MRLSSRLIAAFAALTLLFVGAQSADAATHHHHTPVLGKKHLFEPDGKGWGTYRPAKLDNGGDPSGYVTHIHWKHWGAHRATGHGRTYAFKPGGGYYSRTVKIQFHAYKLGRCSAKGPHAYTQLHFREQKRPGSTHWTKWRSWSGLKNICSRNYS